MKAIFGDPGKAARDAATETRNAENHRQQSIRDGTAAINETFGQFNDPYFQRQQQSYIDYAQPQLDDQYNAAKQQLTYSLARAGTLDSSTRAAQEGKLQQAYDTAQRGVRDTALSYGNQSRNTIEDARASLLSSLNAAGDGNAAANQAISRAQALSQPQTFSPLGQLFGDFTSALGTQAAAEKATMLSGGTYKSPYSTGLFGNAGSVKVG